MIPPGASSKRSSSRRRRSSSAVEGALRAGLVLGLVAGGEAQRLGLDPGHRATRLFVAGLCVAISHCDLALRTAGEMGALRRRWSACEPAPGPVVSLADPGDRLLDAPARLPRALPGPLRQALHAPVPVRAAVRVPHRARRRSSRSSRRRPTSCTRARARGCCEPIVGANSVILLDGGAAHGAAQADAPGVPRRADGAAHRPDRARSPSARSRRWPREPRARAAPADAAADARDHPARRLRARPGRAARRGARPPRRRCSRSATSR